MTRLLCGVGIAGALLFASSSGEAQANAKQYCYPGGGGCFAADMWFQPWTSGMPGSNGAYPVTTVFSVVLKTLGYGPYHPGLNHFSFFFNNDANQHNDCTGVDPNGCVFGALETQSTIGNVRLGDSELFSQDINTGSRQYDWYASGGIVGCKWGPPGPGYEEDRNYAYETCDSHGGSGGCDSTSTSGIVNPDFRNRSIFQSLTFMWVTLGAGVLSRRPVRVGVSRVPMRRSPPSQLP